MNFKKLQDARSDAHTDGKDVEELLVRLEKGRATWEVWPLFGPSV